MTLQLMKVEKNQIKTQRKKSKNNIKPTYVTIFNELPTTFFMYFFSWVISYRITLPKKPKRQQRKNININKFQQQQNKVSKSSLIMKTRVRVKKSMLNDRSYRSEKRCLLAGSIFCGFIYGNL